MKEELGQLLDRMKELDPLTDDYKMLLDRADKLAKQIVDFQRMDNEITIETMRMNEQAEKSKSDQKIEEIKSSISNRKILFELAKTLLPVLMQSAVFIWAVAQTGRYTSSMSRIVHSNMPRIWK